MRLSVRPAHTDWQESWHLLAGKKEKYHIQGRIARERTPAGIPQFRIHEERPERNQSTVFIRPSSNRIPGS
jgi:hypothetical protein